MSSWDKSIVCWVFSRNAGKSMLGGVYILARSILFPSHKTFIMSLTARQSQDTFMKMEDIAKKNITSIKKSNGEIVLAELDKSNGNSSGFSHNKDLYFCKFYNGSEVTALPGDERGLVGKRS